MLFNSLPTLKSGNIPLIMLACHGLDDGHPFAWTRFFPGTKSPCVQSRELKAVIKANPVSFDLWLPTPTVNFRSQAERRLFIAWNIVLEPPPADPNWNDGEGYFQTMLDTVACPRFQVLATSCPSRPTGSEFSFSSATANHVTLTSMTPDDSVSSGPGVTEITGIKAPGEKSKGSRDMLCHLRVQMPCPNPSPSYQPGHMRFYLNGLAVDQW